MTWNGSGLYERLYNWVTDRDAATPIDATKMDAEQDGIVGALNDVVQQNEPFQGPILAQDGTVSSPGYTFNSDLDLGMYRVGLNSGALVAGSAAPLTWTASKIVLLGLDVDVIAEKTPAAGVTIDGVLLKDGGATLATATLASATLTTADINGGTVDGVIIGGASAAAGTFTNIAGTTLQLSNTTSYLQITSTDAGASLGPYIYLTHDSASPANSDETGEIYFRGNDSLGNLTNYSKISGISLDVTNGAEDGGLYFYNRTAGVENIDLRVAYGGVTLAWLGNTKLVTSPTGVTVTGRMDATSLSGDGGSITGMSATQLTSGTVPAARLTEATAAQIRNGTASVLVTPANLEAASEEVTLTDAATIAVDWSTFFTGKVTLAGNRTLGAPTNAEPGTWRTIRVVQDGTGSRTLGFSAVYLTQDNETITLSTGAADKDTLYIYCETTSLFHVTAAYNWS